MRLHTRHHEEHYDSFKLTERPRHGRRTPQEASENLPKHDQVGVGCDFDWSPELCDQPAGKFGWFVKNSVGHYNGHERREKDVYEIRNTGKNQATYCAIAAVPDGAIKITLKNSLILG